MHLIIIYLISAHYWFTLLFLNWPCSYLDYNANLALIIAPPHQFSGLNQFANNPMLIAKSHPLDPVSHNPPLPKGPPQLTLSSPALTNMETGPANEHYVLPASNYDYRKYRLAYMTVLDFLSK